MRPTITAKQQINLAVCNLSQLSPTLLTTWFENSELYQSESVEHLPAVDAIADVAPSGIIICLLPQTPSEEVLEQLQLAVGNHPFPRTIVVCEDADVHLQRRLIRMQVADSIAAVDMAPALLDRSIQLVLTKMEAYSVERSSAALHRELFYSSPQKLFTVDNNWKITSSNTAFRTFFDQSSNELSERPLTDFFVNVEELQSLKNILASEGNVKAYRTRFQLNENDVRIVRITLSLLPEHATGFVLGIIEDITLIEQAERELQLSEKLNLTARMARTIAHEVRNPLTNISLALEALQEELAPANDAEMYLDIIGRNTERIGALVNDLLESARPATPQLRPFSLKEVLNLALDMVHDRLLLKEVACSTAFDQTDAVIQCDPDQLPIAFCNLLTNAIEAMHDAPEPKLEISTSLNAEGRPLVRIADNGVGMDEEQLDRLFEPFFTQKPSGLGLGLTAARNIFRSHNARISIDSKPTQGTTFSILF